MARRVVPGLPRDALVDRTAQSEGLAVPEVLSAQSPAAEAIRRESEPDDASRGLDRGADSLFRLAGIALDDEG